MRGSCLCGAVKVDIDGPVGLVTACHCHQCRKTSGHFAASFDADPARVHWAGAVQTYVTQGGGTRAFCPVCGSRLWFRGADGTLSIEAGLIDGPTGARLAAHIFVAERGDYYDIADGLPQHQGAGDE